MAEISIQRSELFQPLFVLRDLIRDLQGGGASREVQLHPENIVLTSQKLLKLFQRIMLMNTPISIVLVYNLMDTWVKKKNIFNCNKNSH